MNYAKRYLAIFAAAMTMLLTGCATTLRSDVTVFHEWPTQLPDKSYVFEQAPARADTLEYRNYLGLLRGQLAQLGFTEAVDPNAATLKVGMRFSTTDIALRELDASPMWSGPYFPGRYGYRGPWGYSRFGGYGGFGGYYPGFYDPFYAPSMRESIRHEYERRLHITINTLAGKKLYDVTVKNSSMEEATPFVMPALLTSAFSGFPGQSGVAHRVTLKLDDKGKFATAQ